MSAATSAIYWPVISITDTGTQNDYTPGLLGSCVIRCNNATALTITGLAPGFAGQRVIFESIGAGQVNFTHLGGGSTATNRLINFLTSANTSLAAGKGTAEYIYDGTTSRWRLATHQQGDYITFASTLVGWSGTPTQAVMTKVDGTSVHVIYSLTGTSNSTTTTFTVPYTSQFTFGTTIGDIEDNTAQVACGVARLSLSSATVTCLLSTAASFTNSGTKAVSDEFTYAGT